MGKRIYWNNWKKKQKYVLMSTGNFKGIPVIQHTLQLKKSLRGPPPNDSEEEEDKLVDSDDEVKSTNQDSDEVETGVVENGDDTVEVEERNNEFLYQGPSTPSDYSDTSFVEGNQLLYL